MIFHRLERLKRATAAEAFSGEGGLHFALRWNSRGTQLVYTSTSVALACLETLVHMQMLARPEERWWFSIDIPDRCVEKLDRAPRGWDAEPATPVSQRVGDEWITSARSVALLVPSVVVPMEHNALINPLHPQFRMDWVRNPMRFRYDPRLIG